MKVAYLAIFGSLVVLASGCDSSGSDSDAGTAPRDGAVMDGASPLDARVEVVDGAALDAHTRHDHDAGESFDAEVTTDVGIADLDASRVDAGARTDAGVTDARVTDAGLTCDPASCGARSCGRSDCGASCGECEVGFYCNVAGSCVDRQVTPPPGVLCIDAFGQEVVEGAFGFRVCTTDADLLQRCLCGGGGIRDWMSCGACTDVVLDGARGDRCATAAQCADAVPCHPTLRFCGESCDRGGAPVTCPGGTECGIPGDIAGACLPECTTCGASCGDGKTCRTAEGGNVCVPSGYPWPTACR